MAGALAAPEASRAAAGDHEGEIELGWRKVQSSIPGTQTSPQSWTLTFAGDQAVDVSRACRPTTLTNGPKVVE